jgi:hypothetical protein
VSPAGVQFDLQSDADAVHDSPVTLFVAERRGRRARLARDLVRGLGEEGVGSGEVGAATVDGERPADGVRRAGTGEHGHAVVGDVDRPRLTGDLGVDFELGLDLAVVALELEE